MEHDIKHKFFGKVVYRYFALVFQELSQREQLGQRQQGRIDRVVLAESLKKLARQIAPKEAATPASAAATPASAAATPASAARANSLNEGPVEVPELSVSEVEAESDDHVAGRKDQLGRTGTQSTGKKKAAAPKRKSPKKSKPTEVL